MIIQWNGKNGSTIKIVKELGEIDHDVAITRLNDGKCDPRGRLFAGNVSLNIIRLFLCSFFLCYVALLSPDVKCEKSGNGCMQSSRSRSQSHTHNAQIVY